MKSLSLFLFLLFISENCVLAGYCYNTKCRNYNGSYIDCDAEHSICYPGNSSEAPLAHCTPGNSTGVYWCGPEERCKHVEYTGKAYCAMRHLSFLQRNYRFILTGLVQVVAVFSIAAVCYCFLTRRACFSEHTTKEGTPIYMNLE